VSVYPTVVKNKSAGADSAPAARVSLESLNASATPDLRLRSDYRPDIDGLRALAIIPVVIFHAFPAVMPGGFVGVDIFFVISGFLISSIILQALQRGTFSFAGFYANRIKRIFPALIVVLAACFALGWFFLLPDEYTQLGKHMVGAAGYIENLVLRREAGYFDIKSNLKPLMHLWSLGIEEQFYLTYPFFLWSVWRFRRNLWTVLLSITLVSFGLNIWQVHRDPVGAFFLPQTRCWELMVGGAFACWRLLGQEAGSRPGQHWVSNFIESGSLPVPSAVARNAFSGLGLLLVAMAVLRIHENDPFPGWWALLPVGGASLLILGGPDAWINRRILANKPMVFVGLISYPLYLWHWPMLTFPRIIRGSELSVATRTAGVLLSFGLAWATWHYIERPIRFGRKTWIKTAALTAMSVVIGSAGYSAYSSDGFAGRFPDFIRDVGQLREVRWSTPECRRTVGLADIDYCRSTTVGRPDVLLIGDSHASVLYDGLAPAYQKRSQILMNLGQAGCVPFYDTESFSPGVRRKDCKRVLNRIFEFAASSASVGTIILSLRGPRYMSGQGFGPAEAGAGPKEILWEGAPENTGQAEMFTAALRNTISRLYATGKNLILVIDWPELGFDPRSCLPRPVSLFSSPRPFCGVSRTQVDARNRAYRQVVLDLKKEFTGLRVFDPLPYLCDSSACYAMTAGHLLYSDDNHISNAGATYLSGKFFEEQFPQAKF
jgi:peptidoglycan/LPS O-acetylase OafA/YrhL